MGQNLALKVYGSPRKICGCSSVVEHFLAKEDVARSNRVTRSISHQRDAFHTIVHVCLVKTYSFTFG
jgi:hypothetical protein